MDNQPRVYQLVTFHKCLLSMDRHHKMVLVLLQEPDNGSDKLLKWSHAQADLTSLYNDPEKGIKENPRTLEPLHREGWRDLYTDNLFPEIMRLIYWVKVNSSMTIFMDHLWSIPFHDKCFQCNLLFCIITFCVWAWFLLPFGISWHVIALSHPSITIRSP